MTNNSVFHPKRLLLGAATLLFVSGSLSMSLISCAPEEGQQPDPVTTKPIDKDKIDIPAGFPAMPIPADNQYSAAKAELGRYLFYDKRMSVDNSISCASCHQADKAFSDYGKDVSAGVNQATGTRNASSLVNIAYQQNFFWDGREHSLEAQSLDPVQNPKELGGSDDPSYLAKIIDKIKAEPKYAELFSKAYPNETNAINVDNVRKAIATFERTMISGESDYDKWRRNDPTAQFSKSAERGLALFLDSNTNCSQCHSGVNFTDDKFHSTGIEQVYGDPGLELITNRPGDNGKFKTPSLRNCGISEPYDHNGKFSTLDEVIRHYNDGGMHNNTQDSLIHKLHLTDQQVKDIANFLRSLTDTKFLNNPAFKNPWVQ